MTAHPKIIFAIQSSNAFQISFQSTEVYDIIKFMNFQKFKDDILKKNKKEFDKIHITIYCMFIKEGKSGSPMILLGFFFQEFLLGTLRDPSSPFLRRSIRG